MPPKISSAVSPKKAIPSSLLRSPHIHSRFCEREVGQGSFKWRTWGYELLACSHVPVGDSRAVCVAWDEAKEVEEAVAGERVAG